MGFTYEVGDIVTLKKSHPCGSKDWEIPPRGSGFPSEMHRLRASDHGPQEDGGEEHPEPEETAVERGQYERRQPLCGRRSADF